MGPTRTQPPVRAGNHRLHESLKRQTISRIAVSSGHNFPNNTSVLQCKKVVLLPYCLGKVDVASPDCCKMRTRYIFIMTVCRGSDDLRSFLFARPTARYFSTLVEDQYAVEVCRGPRQRERAGGTSGYRFVSHFQPRERDRCTTAVSKL